MFARWVFGATQRGRVAVNDVVITQQVWDSLDFTDLVSQETSVTDVQGCISSDLNEATYSQPHEILDLNFEFMDVLLKEHPLWRVYHRLFKINNRSIDMTELFNKEYCSYETASTKRGGFMGDPVSFIHLTLQMAATVNSSCILTGITSKEKHTRPLGQTVGDDGLLLGVSQIFYKNLADIFQRCGMSLSKIDSWSTDSLTFCEQYAVKPTGKVPDGYPKESQFGDLLFLDTIKGSILSGKSKVKANGSEPFIGHSTMLNKQLKWHPIQWIKERAPRLLLCTNYNRVVKLSSNMASLPSSLGGIDMAIGRVITWDDESFQKRLPYYEAILKLPKEQFFEYYILLQGVYHANPKGQTWTNDIEVINSFFQSEEAVKVDNLPIPLWLASKGFLAKIRYLRDEFNLISLTEVTSQLARREAFLDFWNEKSPKTFMTLPLKEPRLRASKAWEYIYRTVKPVDRTEYVNIPSLASAFWARSEGVFFKADSEALREIFSGMPSLKLDYLPSF